MAKKRVIKAKLKDIFSNSVLVALVMVLAAVGLAIVSRPDGLLHIYFCDVGQGDAIFIKTPENRQILVDGGPDDRVLNCLSQALPFYDRSLDLIVLTHPHADHVNGLTSALSTYRVDKVVFYQLDYESADYQEFIDLVGEQGLDVLPVLAGDNLALDQQVSAGVWYPLSKENLQVLGASVDPYDSQKVNDSSIILQLTCGDFSTLLTGDAPDSVQELLWRQGTVSQSDILKVAHHGANDGLNEEFLKKAAPQLAVISVGQKNLYGHPHKKTLEELQNANIPLKRTDLDGTIEIVSDCQDWWTK